MKKRGLVLLMLLLLMTIGLCGCKRKDVVYWKTLPAGEPVNDADYPDLELKEQVLVDEDGIKVVVPASTVTALRLQEAGTIRYEIPIRIENGTKKEISISGSEHILNGYQRPGKEHRDLFFGEGCLWLNEEKTPYVTFIPKNSAVKCKMVVSPEALRYTGDMVIQEIAMTLSCALGEEKKDYDVQIQTTFYTGVFAKELPMISFEVGEGVLYHENGVCIKVEKKTVEASEMYFGGYDYEIPILVENMTEQRLVLEADEISVNDITMDFSVTSREDEGWELDAPANSVQEGYIRLSVAELWKKDVYEIKELDASFHCRILENEETGYRTKYVDFEAKIPVVQ